MPNGEYEYTDISLADFEAALNVIINQLESEAKRKTPTWEKMARQIMPSWMPGIGQETIEEQFNRMFDEIMAAVTQYGLSPDVARTLSPEVANIFNVTLRNRTSYEWQKQYKEDLGQWKKDVVSQIQKDYKTQAEQQRWGQQEEWKRWGAELDVAKWQQAEAWKRYGTAQEQVQKDWELKQARKGAEMSQQAYREQARYYTEERARAGQLSDRQKAQMFESMRAELLAGFGGAGDWIKRWMVANAPNRYAVTSDREMSIGKFAEKYGMSTTAALETSERFAEGAFAPEFEALTPEQRADLSATKKRKGQREVPKYETPPTPQWLGAMYPQLGGRIPTQQAGFEMAPPSGQAWGKLTPSQQAGWGGFAEHYGASPEDLLFQTEQMAPRSPWQTPQRRWTPAKQRVSV